MIDQFASPQRLFIGIIPPKETLDQLRDIKRLLKKEARNFRFVSIEQLHITLQFLGSEVSPGSKDYISTMLKEVDFGKKFSVVLDKLNFGFPGQATPSILFWSIKKNHELKQLTSDVHESIKSLNLGDIKKRKDHAKLIHHMTIARLKGTSNKSYARQIREKIQVLNFPEIRFEVSKFQLIKSEFRTTAYHYTIEDEIELN